MQSASGMIFEPEILYRNQSHSSQPEKKNDTQIAVDVTRSVCFFLDSPYNFSAVCKVVIINSDLIRHDAQIQGPTR